MECLRHSFHCHKPALASHEPLGAGFQGNVDLCAHRGFATDVCGAVSLPSSGTDASAHHGIWMSGLITQHLDNRSFRMTGQSYRLGNTAAVVAAAATIAIAAAIAALPQPARADDCPSGGSVRFGVEPYDTATRLIPIYEKIGKLISDDRLQGRGLCRHRLQRRNRGDAQWQA